MTTKEKKLSFTGHTLLHPSSNLNSFFFAQWVRVKYQKQDIANSKNLIFTLKEERLDLQSRLQWSENEIETLTEELAEIQTRLIRVERAICKPEEQEEKARIVECIRFHEENHQKKIEYRQERIHYYNNELKQVNLKIHQLERSTARKQNSILPRLKFTLEETRQKLERKQEVLTFLKSKQPAINLSTRLVVDNQRSTPKM